MNRKVLLFSIIVLILSVFIVSCKKEEKLADSDVTNGVLSENSPRSGGTDASTDTETKDSSLSALETVNNATATDAPTLETEESATVTAASTLEAKESVTATAEPTAEKDISDINSLGNSDSEKSSGKEKDSDSETEDGRELSYEEKIEGSRVPEIEGALSRAELRSIFTAYVARIRAAFQDEENYKVSHHSGRFSLAFIDDDKIPELVISPADAHASKCYVFFYDPQTVGTIDCGDTFGETGAFKYYKYRSCIRDYHMGQGFVTTSFCHFKEDHTVERGHIFGFGYSDDGTELKTFLEEERVENSVFEAAYEEELEPYKEEGYYMAPFNDDIGDYEDAFSDNAEDILYQIYIELLNRTEPIPKNWVYDYEERENIE